MKQDTNKRAINYGVQIVSLNSQPQTFPQLWLGSLGLKPAVADKVSVLLRRLVC